MFKGPNIASMGLISINDRENETKESVNTNFENVSKINFNQNNCYSLMFSI